MVGRADKEDERKHRFEEKGRGTDDKEANFRKITGHVEDESLWLLEVPTIQLQYSNRRKSLTKKSVRDDVEDSSSASSTSMESRKRKSHKSDQNEEPSLGTKNPQDTPTAKVGILNAHSKSISEGGSLSEPAKNDEYGFNSDDERQNHQVAQENIQLTNQRVSWAGVVKAAQLTTRDQKAHCPLEDRIIGDLVDMGFGKNEISPKLVANGLSETSCLKLDDDSGEMSKEKPTKEPSILEEVCESETLTLPEVCITERGQNSKGRKYGSLFDIQDRALSKLERKKRDRAKRRSKQAGNSSPPVEVEGRSLSDSDLQLRRDILIREAKKTLQVGKSIGIQFRGDEN
ncbi:hypothetical protein V6N11_037582 [Hibiscus sabdariffa]|uniref:Uncharacterized protein n=2 Tax=Hibiscus sabdariffa TaxID=183260 RepID=A0ABR2PBQ9_9ROSI